LLKIEGRVQCFDVNAYQNINYGDGDNYVENEYRESSSSSFEEGTYGK
jgi:hypothetical protein